MSTVTLTGDDYRYRFKVEAKQRFIDVIRERFNAGVLYKNRLMKWDTVIEQKTIELSRFVSSKATDLDFTNPAPLLERPDNKEIREKVLSLTPSEAHKLGIGKSTFHYLRKNARDAQSFRSYEKTSMKIRSTAIASREN